jgi:hypothetical protein
MRNILACICLVACLSAVNGGTLQFDAVACSPATQPRVMTDPTGSFVSANYPSNYPDNVDCQWRIRAQPGQVINIDFVAFSTERRFDIVYFFDGDSLLSPAIFGLDGDRSPAPTGVRSSGEVMYVWFKSDALTNATGFSATYQSVPADPPSAIGACNPGSRPLTLSASFGTITTPYHMQTYPVNCDCQWLIEAEDTNGFVKLDFTNFLTQPNNDWVVVYDGPNASSPLIARLSGNYAQPPGGFQTTQRYMYVRFASSGNLVTRGFSANYQSVTVA